MKPISPGGAARALAALMQLLLCMLTTNKDEDQKPNQADSRSDVSPRQFDPVCGMDVDPNATTVERIDRKGVSYYFCSADCRRQFEASPEEFGA